MDNRAMNVRMLPKYRSEVHHTVMHAQAAAAAAAAPAAAASSAVASNDMIISLLAITVKWQVTPILS
jgi:hypothetical protein